MKIRIAGHINDGFAEAPPLDYEVDYTGTARLVGAPLLSSRRYLSDLLAETLVNDETGEFFGPGYTVTITVLEELPVLHERRPGIPGQQGEQ